MFAPRSARCYAIDAPMIPVPTITTQSPFAALKYWRVTNGADNS